MSDSRRQVLRRVVAMAAASLAAANLVATGFPQQEKESGFLAARPGYRYRFPRDHASHPGYKTEWWYYTGHLKAETGERFGFQLTFFRSGVRPPEKTGPSPGSRWAVRDLYFAHFAVSDFQKKTFFFDERMSRGALGEAGAEAGRYRVWVKDWRGEAVETSANAAHRLRAGSEEYAIGLIARPAKPPAIHGLEGVSGKGAGKNQASHYISYTRMEVAGTLRVGKAGRGRKLSVRGLAWMDHEFGSGQLEKEQAGWDWFGIRLDDGSEVMLYLMRKKDGSADPASSGTWIKPDGKTVHLDRKSFEVEVLERWKSRESGAVYPIRWRVRIPSRRAALVVEPDFPDQELITRKSTQVTYWEGSVRVQGEAEGKPVRGEGYVEMTGYAGAFKKKI